MGTPNRDESAASRGQAMVEFALMLPLLALLLVLALDFGRVFFGYVALQNAARVGANHAAQNPTAWSDGDVALQADYRAEVLRDMQAINCAPPGGTTWTTADIPNPTFTSLGGTADPYELGDHATVTLDCRMSFLTPLVEVIVGTPMNIAAEADFPVRGGVIAGTPVGSTPPPAPTCIDAVVPDMVGMAVQAARDAWTAAGFIGEFSPTSGQDTETVATQTTTPASAPGDCMPTWTLVAVTSVAPSTCTTPDLAVPNLVGRTVSQARGDWTTAGFTGTFNPSSGSDSEVVDTQSLTAGTCEPDSASISVTYGAPAPTPVPTCTAPELLGSKVSIAQGSFTTAGFTGAFTVTRPPSNDYVVETQSLVGGQKYPCTSGITVGPKP